MLQIISDKLEELKLLDTDFKNFGAESHRYTFNLKIEEEEIHVKVDDDKSLRRATIAKERIKLRENSRVNEIITHIPKEITKNKTIKVIVPDYRMNNKTEFNYDGVTAFMKVNTSNENLPMLGVYEVFSVASGDLSLPYKVKK